MLLPVERITKRVLCTKIPCLKREGKDTTETSSVICCCFSLRCSNFSCSTFPCLIGFGNEVFRTWARVKTIMEIRSKHLKYILFAYILK